MAFPSADCIAVYIYQQLMRVRGVSPTMNRPETGEDRDRGQSEVIGTVLLIGIVLLGSTVAVVFGAVGIKATQDNAQNSGVEHAMTQFDSQAAMVALGNSGSQSMRLSSSEDGTYTVRPDAGWVNITHHNHSGNGDTKTLVNTTLGALVYETDDSTITYQGGGVWRGSENESTMISPPEFHYRGSTLTLPIISVNGTDSFAGSGRASVSVEDRSRRIFPNASEPSYGNQSYRNPIDSGNVTVTIHSDSYVAWAEYLEQRTEGSVKIHHSNRTAAVTLIAERVIGPFTMPREGNALDMRNLEEGHSLTQFEITIEVDRWNQLQWSLHESTGNQEFEFHVASDGSGQCTKVDTVDLSVYYYNGTTNKYQGWQNESVQLDSDSSVNADCSADTLTIDLAGSTPLNYTDITISGSDNKWYYGSEIDSRSLADPIRFDQHFADTEGDRNGIYNESEIEELGFLMDHYFALLGPDFELEVADGPANSNSVNEGASKGEIFYHQTRGKGFLTFLHITKNQVKVEID